MEPAFDNRASLVGGSSFRGTANARPSLLAERLGRRMPDAPHHPVHPPRPSRRTTAPAVPAVPPSHARRQPAAASAATPPASASTSPSTSPSASLSTSSSVPAPTATSEAEAPSPAREVREEVDTISAPHVAADSEPPRSEAGSDGTGAASPPPSTGGGIDLAAGVGDGASATDASPETGSASVGRRDAPAPPHASETQPASARSDPRRYSSVVSAMVPTRCRAVTPRTTPLTPEQERATLVAADLLDVRACGRCGTRGSVLCAESLYLCGCLFVSMRVLSFLSHWCQLGWVCVARHGFCVASVPL